MTPRSSYTKPLPKATKGYTVRRRKPSGNRTSSPSTEIKTADMRLKENALPAKAGRKMGGRDEGFVTRKESRVQPNKKF